MVADPTLTYFESLRRTGHELEYHECFAPWTLDPGVSLDSCGLYDATWTVSSNSHVVRALKNLRDAQHEFGFSSLQAKEAGKEFYFARRRTGIFAFASGYTSQQNTRKHYEVIADDESLGAYQAAKEALSNAIEHGSDYCSKGLVRVRFIGGVHAGLLEVTDPGTGNIRIPLSVEEILDVHRKSGRKFLSRPQNYKELIRARRHENWPDVNLSRGYGAICFTLSKAAINAETHKDGYTVRMLYDPETIPEWHR